MFARVLQPRQNLEPAVIGYGSQGDVKFHIDN
jgi:ketol-acid reductoisomerase